jgi:hypothetical protein
VEPAVEAYAFLGMFINETIDNKVRKTICEEAWKVCFFFFLIMELVKLQIEIWLSICIFVFYRKSNSIGFLKIKTKMCTVSVSYQRNQENSMRASSA